MSKCSVHKCMTGGKIEREMDKTTCYIWLLDLYHTGGGSKEPKSNTVPRKPSHLGWQGNVSLDRLYTLMVQSIGMMISQS